MFFASSGSSLITFPSFRSFSFVLIFVFVYLHVNAHIFAIGVCGVRTIKPPSITAATTVFTICVNPFPSFYDLSYIQ